MVEGVLSASGHGVGGEVNRPREGGLARRLVRAAGALGSCGRSSVVRPSAPGYRAGDSRPSRRPRASSTIRRSRTARASCSASYVLGGERGKTRARLPGPPSLLLGACVEVAVTAEVEPAERRRPRRRGNRGRPPAAQAEPSSNHSRNGTAYSRAAPRASRNASTVTPEGACGRGSAGCFGVHREKTRVRPPGRA